MARIAAIRQMVRQGAHEFAIPHFFEEMLNDGLAFADIEEAVARGRIRRRFADDARGTRCEIVGPATDGRQIAVICRVKATGKLLFIATYASEQPRR